MAEDVLLRVACPADAPALLEIYAPYVRDTAISFEYDVPETAAFAARIALTLQRYPYLAAERDGELLGYAYTGAFHPRAAYDRAAETSIYLRGDCRGCGLGRRLYTALEALSRAQNVQNLYACIAWPEADDPHLTRASAAFHAHLGYTLVGKFCRCGYKFGTWYSMVWMEKLLGAHEAEPAPFVQFPQLSAQTLLQAGVRPAPDGRKNF